MNFFEHHIGDYDEATSHLSAREDGIYHRLIRKVYAKERPLPADINLVQRWARCRDDEDREAVVAVLAEFFDLREDGYHQKTCDEVLARYKAGAPEREVKKQNEDNRVKRHRLERSRLFQVLVSAGQHAPWNISIVELRAMVAQLPGQKGPPATADDRKPATPERVTGTEPVMPATATQYPVASPQHSSSHYPVANGELGFGPGADAPAPVPTPAPPPTKPRKKKAAEPLKTAPLWDAYSHAFQERYSTLPPRNAMVNGLLSQLVDRLGAEEAPAVAEFYVRSNHPYYVNAGHVIQPLVRDAEKLRTQWFTGRSVTVSAPGAVDVSARNADARRLLFGDQGERDAPR